MTIAKSYHETANVVRLEPTSAQEELFEKNFGCCRFVFNWCLELKTFMYKETGWNHSGYELMSMLPMLKRENPWLSEVDAWSLQKSVKDLDQAYHRFFTKQNKFPRFKSKRRSGQSFCLGERIETNGSSLRIGKHGWVKCRGLRLETLAADKLQSVTVYKEAGKYYASIMYREELDYQKEHVNSGSSCGIDIGIAHPATIVDGKGNSYFVGKKTQTRLKELEVKRKRYQRRVVRKMKGSKRREKVKLVVQRAYQKEKFVRKDFNHKLSNTLARKYETVVMEDLNLKNMTRSAKGTVDKPGKSVRAKSGLNRELQRMAPGQLYQFLSYKCPRYGGRLVTVDPKNTSLMCRKCKCINKLNRKSQAVFKCIACGHKEHADINAGGNLNDLGLIKVAA